MDALPWLVIHGAAVWKTGLLLSILTGAALAWLRVRLAARRAAAAARRLLGEPASSLRLNRRSWRVTLEGRIEVGPGACLPPGHGDGSAVAAFTRSSFSGGLAVAGARARAERLLLRVGDTAVRLDGPIEVATGSRETWPGRVLGPPAAELRSLAPGDRVLVAGVLAEEASDEGPSYRDAGKRWTLSGGLVAAFAGAPRVRGPAAAVLVPPAIAAAAVFLGLAGLGGEVLWARAARELTVHASSSAGGDLRAAALAAAAPFRRAAALAGLSRALDARRDPDPRSLAARAALHELRGAKAEAAAMWIAHGEPERGARLAEEAQGFALAARGWYAAGEFARAAEAWDRQDLVQAGGADEDELRFGLGLHLLAGRLDRAARTAERLGVVLRAHPATNGRLERWYQLRAETVECVAWALDARGGVSPAGDRFLRRRSTGVFAKPEPMLPGCAVLWLDLFDGPARLAAIRTLPPIDPEAFDVPRAWLGLLAAEASAYSTQDVALPFESAAEVVAVSSGEALWNMVPGIERRLAETLAAGVPQETLLAERCEEVNRHRKKGSPCDRVKPSWTPTRVSEAAALFAFLSGDEGGARALGSAALQAFRPFAHGRFGHQEPSPEALAATMALPGDGGPAQDLLARASTDRFLYPPGEMLHGLLDLVVERNAGPLLDALGRNPPPDEAEKQAWALAAAGDGEGLARWLRRPHSRPGTFLRLGAPLLRAGRADVARWIRWGYRAPAGFHPTEEVVQIANLAAAAAALAPAEAAPLEARARRFRDAILRRETAIPLAVIERI